MKTAVFGTILDTIRWLSIALGAMSLFFLGQTAMEFGLSDGFMRMQQWYVETVHPVVGLAEPPLGAVVQWFGWSLPNWWKEGVVLYLMMGAATGRSATRADCRAMPTTQAEREKFRREMVPRHIYEEAVARHLALTPVRMIAWPLFWLSDLMLDPTTLDSTRSGYIGLSLLEFAKIALGALIFAALNAGN